MLRFVMLVSRCREVPRGSHRMTRSAPPQRVAELADGLLDPNAQKCIRETERVAVPCVGLSSAAPIGREEGNIRFRAPPADGPPVSRAAHAYRLHTNRFQLRDPATDWGTLSPATSTSISTYPFVASPSHLRGACELTSWRSLPWLNLTRKPGVLTDPLCACRKSPSNRQWSFSHRADRKLPALPHAYCEKVAWSGANLNPTWEFLAAVGWVCPKGSCLP